MDSRLRGNDGIEVGVVIPAKAGIHRCSPLTHGGAPDTAIAIGPAAIPAKAGIHRCSPLTHGGASGHGNRPSRDSREGGNPSVFSAHARWSTGHGHRNRPSRHSREGGNPSVFSAHAAVEHRTRPSQSAQPSFPRRRESIGVLRSRTVERRTRRQSARIPAKAGIHEAEAAEELPYKRVGPVIARRPPGHPRARAHRGHGAPGPARRAGGTGPMRARRRGERERRGPRRAPWRALAPLARPPAAFPGLPAAARPPSTRRPRGAHRGFGRAFTSRQAATIAMEITR